MQVRFPHLVMLGLFAAYGCGRPSGSAIGPWALAANWRSGPPSKPLNGVFIRPTAKIPGTDLEILKDGHFRFSRPRRIEGTWTYSRTRLAFRVQSVDNIPLNLFLNQNKLDPQCQMVLKQTLYALLMKDGRLAAQIPSFVPQKSLN